VYNVETGKLKKCVKGSSSDEGALLKVQVDPSGSFFATSCSDKNINIFDYESGECVATLFGHSEIVTCMRFSQDCRHLITVSGDSCVFVWRLDSQMTSTMRKRRGLKLSAAPETCRNKRQNIRRDTFITGASSQLPQMEEEEEEEADLGTPARLGSAQDAPLLQTNGKLPMWFRRLQGEGGASSNVQSAAEPRQVRSRWAEQLNPLTICSNSSPSPTRSQEEEEEPIEEEEEEEEEEEGDFHPQSLESLLGGEKEEEDNGEEEEEKEVLQNPGDNSSGYILYPTTASSNREFDVEAVTDPRRSLAQLSPDSASSEGSAGSVEQQQEADTDSLSQGSSVSSLVLEDDEDGNSLKNHFDTLSSSLSDEKFDTDLKSLQPPEEKHYLNPRLSISTRFLSRFQDRIRSWPSRAPPPVSIQTRISEESNVSNVSNTSVSSELSSDVVSTESKENSGVRCSQSIIRRRASCMISHQPLRRPTRRRRHTVVVVQCREPLRDVTSRTLAAHNSCVVTAVQQAAPRLGYLGTTASSRAKLSQDPPTTAQEEEEEEKKENLSSSGLQPPAPLLPAGLDLHSTKPDPHQDQTSSVTLSSLVLATPTRVMSQGGVRRFSSVEETLTTDQNLTLTPASSVTLTATPTACDIITSDIISCSASRQEEEGSGGPETRIRTDPDPSVAADLLSSDPPTSSSSPLSEKPRPPQTGPGGDEDDDEDDEESVSLQQCQQVANELRQTARRAVHLYRQVGGSDRCLQMSSVLQGAFAVVHSELQAVLLRGGGVSSARLEDDGTTSLLEKYSELLVQMTQNKLNRV
ncbi:WD repeat-containing protein 62-like, partial [Anarhichas minor]|uniref:WD repeat-containing protein 62-like n=1 Tax=Anarhichas minor TaxID=65739 RepID=UPI003F73204A